MFSDYDVFFDDSNQCYQVRTKMNTFVLDFDDEIKKEVFEKLLVTPKSKLALIHEKLTKEYEESKVLDVFNTLNEFGLLPPEEYACLVNPSENEQATEGEFSQGLKSINDFNLLIISQGAFGDSLKELLIKEEVKNIKLISQEDFANQSDEALDETISNMDFCFMDSSNWNPVALSRLNTFSLKHHKPWLHIGGLEEINLKIGPLFLGDETGCYDCFSMRSKSNYEHVDFLNEYEKHLRVSKKSSKQDVFIHENSMYAILANYAFLEFTKFAQMWYVPSTWKKLITINALSFETQSHDLLKVPFCETCNQKQQFNPAPWLEPISIY